MSPAVEEKLARAVALHERGLFSEAQCLYEEILGVMPRSFDALHLLGVIAVQTKQPAKAVEWISRAIRIHASDAVAFFNLGLAWQQLGELPRALASYDRAIDLQPGFAAAYCNRGVIQKALGCTQDAQASFEAAIACHADFAEAHYNLGLCLHALGRREDALDSFDNAISLQSNYGDAYLSRGNLLRELDRWEDAKQSYDRAIELRPSDPGALCNRGALFHERQETGAAILNYECALEIDPAFAPARVNRGLAFLLTGDYARGWTDYEWRRQVAGGPLHSVGTPRPEWANQPSLAGKTLLLRAEEGFGDTIQFCRYARLAADRGAKVVLEVQEPLVTLLRGLDGPATVYAQGDNLPEYDIECPLLSMPLAFGTTLATIPADVPYIACERDKLSHWRQLIGERRRPKVGIVWSGGIRPDRPDRWAANHRRNVPLRLLSTLGELDVDFFSLQKGAPAEAELADLLASRWEGPVLEDLTGRLRDFSDTAALIHNLDLVISVDTATAHLAGALGKPVWIMNRFDTCWRWLLDRTDSPWYPTARLYRQPRAGEWHEVIEKVRADLDSWVSEYDGRK